MVVKIVGTSKAGRGVEFKIIAFWKWKIRSERDWEENGRHTLTYLSKEYGMIRRLSSFLPPGY
jgi:hypothetical protein